MKEEVVLLIFCDEFSSLSRTSSVESLALFRGDVFSALVSGDGWGLLGCGRTKSPMI